MNASKNNILIVDDEPGTRKLVEYNLIKKLRVTTAANKKSYGKIDVIAVFKVSKL